MDKNELKKIIREEILTAVAAETGKKLVPVAVSGRHVHLSTEHVDRLFGKGYALKPIKALSQPDQYACEETVSIKTAKGVIHNVRVLGPERADTQVELSVTDCYKLGIKPTLRMSGDLNDSPGCTLLSKNSEVQLNFGVIVAQRHLHISDEQAIKYGLHDEQTIALRSGDQRATVLENVTVRAGKAHDLEVHIDTDEANCGMIKNGDFAEILE